MNSKLLDSFVQQTFGSYEKAYENNSVDLEKEREVIILKKIF